ncbi:hypothetical protein GGI25_000096 [Coemansia spiralis]|uniref:FAD/NAD(P)-binding domain-containing protein n=2 Tax=Coemansia TaxID=4863 RepID=A0A9W8GCL0_9FUNG|nr:hypothetical protein BX070DRAFT_249705 [Coemansia spiralis]KAJ1992595.1 hypothetical protein EDC05_002741 [Coemansia umbellata]KAJ2620285.1 hypothetical protein GGI26_005109 [Coemansia sp. RSA 1358]KAJ2681141.1 hypothetical protein GGI25_000096 [Coemansia spiralis]
MHLVSSPIRIVVAGGNFAGLPAIRNLYLNLLATNSDYDGTSQAPPNPDIKITLIDRRDGFVHYLGMPRGLAQPEYGRKLWIPYSDLPWLKHSSIEIKKNIVSRITPTHVELADSDEKVEFDYLVISMGLSRNAPIGVAASTYDEYLAAMEKYQTSIKDAQSIVVVGGGAVGCELAADIKSDYPHKDVTLIHSRDLPIPGPFKDEFRKEAVRALHMIGVKTMFGERVVEEESSLNDDFSLESNAKYSSILPELVDSVKRNAILVTSSGNTVSADLVFNCLGFKSKESLIDLPSSTDQPIFSPDGIRVNVATMQIDDPKYLNIFAAGDISNRGLVKLAGNAANGGEIAGNSIAALIRAKKGEPAKVAHAHKEGSKGSRGGPGKSKVYGKMKLVLGGHHAVIQFGDEVVPTEAAISMVSPDVKLGKATRILSIGKYPTFDK